jgi:hypothetical protein
MPYTYKKVGNKTCVYNKNTGKKVGCTTGPIKKYLSALYANVPDSTTEQLKNSIKSLIKEILTETEKIVMRTKVVNDKIENVLNDNVGLPFDSKEKQTILFKQGTLGVKSNIQKNGTEVKFSTSDMFNNNKINILKKLKNMSDPSTLVYASFFTAIPTEPEEESQPQQDTAAQQPSVKKEEKSKVYIKISQPFVDKSNDKLDILGDFIQQLDT